MIKKRYKVRQIKEDQIICHISASCFLGQECLIDTITGKKVKGEIVHIKNDEVTIKMLQPGKVERGSCVDLLPKVFTFPLMPERILGKVINCYGETLYGEDEYLCDDEPVIDLAIAAEPIPLADRAPITDIFPTKIKAIDGLFTLGVGQRMGLFAPAGAGKTTTLSLMANNMDADVVIFAMIGERAREVVEFCSHDIGQDVLQNSIMIVSTSEANPLEKIRSGLVAVSIARYFMEQGKRVVLYFDSLTRFARAQSMLDNTPITNKSIPNGISLSLSKLVECCGNSTKGSVTGIFSVLIEAEIDDDPIAHEVKSLIDGHLVFSSVIAAAGRYPAIDILKSKSRLQGKIQQPEHVRLSNKIKDRLERYANAEMLVQMGEYKKGFDLETDVAIESNGRIVSFLKQDMSGIEYDETIQKMQEICEDHQYY